MWSNLDSKVSSCANPYMVCTFYLQVYKIYKVYIIMYHHQNMNMEHNTETKLIALNILNIPITTYTT